MDVGIVTLGGEDGLAELSTVLDYLAALLIDDGLVSRSLNSKLLKLLVVFGLLSIVATNGGRACGDPCALKELVEELETDVIP